MKTMSERAVKLVTREEAAGRCADWRREGLKVVFTNGVFDLLHRGHVEYLSEARSLGDRLVVGVNDDRSVRTLGKGSDRPLNPLDDRLAVLAGLAAIDLLVPFHEETPLELITLLRPQVLVKGGDYTEEEVVGATEVRADGGEVVLIPLREGYSTSAFLERVRENT
jgi:D-beta-D-heptose 7-phosphate kinase/D-beta-D-heptose 1-phosphate adenosyltransferase